MLKNKSLVKETVEYPYRGLWAAIWSDVEHVMVWKEVHLWQVGEKEDMYTNSTTHVNILNIKNHTPQCQKVKYG